MAGIIVAFDGWNASGVGWGDQGWGQGSSSTIGAGEIGTATAVIDTHVVVAGEQGTTALGNVTIVAPATATVSGVAATGAVNTVTVQGTASVSLAGVEGTGQAGTAHVRFSFPVTGVYATGRTGKVLIWEVTQNVQTPNWVEINN